MVNWQSSEVIERTMAAFVDILHLLLGVYVWFQIAHVPYLVARYAHLVTLITTISTTSVGNSPSDSMTASKSCSGLALMRVVSICGDLALTASNCNLAVRAIALWRHNRKISSVLGGLCMVDCCFALILGFAGVSVFWDSQHAICTIGIGPRAKPALLSFYAFSVSWGLIILIMTVLGIRKNELPKDSPMSSALFTQSAGYVVTIIVTCIPMAVMSFLELNQVMNVLFLPIGCTICIIASTASVTSLLRLKPQSDRPELQSLDCAPTQQTLNLNTSEKDRSNVLSTVVHLSEACTTTCQASGDV